MVRCVVLVCVTACGFRSQPVDSDAARPELIIEAESFSSATTPGGFHWSLVTDPAGYSGTGLMQCQPATGTACSNLAQVPVCAAQLVYQVTIAELGTYFFHVRALARTRTDDSLWYGVDNAVAPNELTFDGDNRWHWSTGESFVLTAGPHTVHIWQREAGARVDALALTTSASPPP